MDTLAKMIGKRVKAIRTSKGLRQEDVEDLGLSYKYFQLVEQGKANLTLKTIEKVAMALDVDVRDLFLIPMNESESTNQLLVSVQKVIASEDQDKINKLNLFIEQFLLDE